ncbi:DUF4394 domain-containing protein [Actinomycetes bacterium KLBMP 9797]
MGSRIRKSMAAAAALAAVTVGTVAGFSASGTAAAAPSMQAFGIAGGGTLMLSFWTDTPQVNDWVRRISGLVGDTYVVGIDIRVQDRKLYAVGNQGGIYTIAVGGTGVTATKVSQLAQTLYGTKFGVDFNPAADRLRVISDQGQNLRHNLADHSTIGDANLTTNGAGTKGVTAAAYTNNDLDPTTATTLFDIGTVTDEVLIQSPANNGTLAATGKLGVDATLDAGFDIFSSLTNGKATAVTGFATLNPAHTPNVWTFYTVNLLNGAAMPVGDFPLDVTDVAIAL